MTVKGTPDVSVVYRLYRPLNHGHLTPEFIMRASMKKGCETSVP